VSSVQFSTITQMTGMACYVICHIQ